MTTALLILLGAMVGAPIGFLLGACFAVARRAEEPR